MPKDGLMRSYPWSGFYHMHRMSRSQRMGNSWCEGLMFCSSMILCNCAHAATSLQRPMAWLQQSSQCNTAFAGWHMLQ